MSVHATNSHPQDHWEDYEVVHSATVPPYGMIGLILKQYAQRVGSLTRADQDLTYHLNLEADISDVLFPEGSRDDLSRFLRNKAKELSMILILTLYLNHHGYRKVKGTLTSLEKDIYGWVDANFRVNQEFFHIDFTTNHKKYESRSWKTLVIYMDDVYIRSMLRSLQQIDAFSSITEARAWVRNYIQLHGFPFLTLKNQYGHNEEIWTYFDRHFSTRRNRG